MSQVQTPQIARPGVAPGGMAPAMPPPLATPSYSPELAQMRLQAQFDARLATIETIVRGMAATGGQNDQSIQLFAQHFAVFRQDTTDFANSTLDRLQAMDQALVNLRAELDAIAPVEAEPAPKRRAVAKKQPAAAGDIEPSANGNDVVVEKPTKIDGRFKK